MEKINKSEFVSDRLRNAANLFEERASKYGKNYFRFGRIMKALLPEAPFSEAEWTRIGLLVHMVTKMSRYGNLFSRATDAEVKPGEGASSMTAAQDSLDDLSVYAQMLAEIDVNVCIFGDDFEKGVPKEEPVTLEALEKSKRELERDLKFEE